LRKNEMSVLPSIRCFVMRWQSNRNTKIILAIRSAILFTFRTFYFQISNTIHFLTFHRVLKN
jgi:hypothetical protein